MKLLSALFVLPCLPSLASAQTYPDRPIRILVPLAAGSAVDIVARLVADKMGEQARPANLLSRRCRAPPA